jgi:uncharacterized protein
MKPLLLTALLAVAGVAHAASFDCKLAKTETEKAICANEEVSNLDEYLGRYYAAARDTLKGAGKCLVTDQRIWIREKRNPCKDAACLRAAYLERLAVLDPLQPGATAIRDIELPSVWSLAWIVPPAADTVAAPPTSKLASSLRARGTIVNDIAGGGDGYSVQAHDGKKVLFLPAMFIEPTTADVLESLIKIGGEYELRGTEEKSGDGSVHFAPSRCIYIRRAPAPQPK